MEIQIRNPWVYIRSRIGRTGFTLHYQDRPPRKYEFTPENNYTVLVPGQWWSEIEHQRFNRDECLQYKEAFYPIKTIYTEEEE